MEALAFHTTLHLLSGQYSCLSLIRMDAIYLVMESLLERVLGGVRQNSASHAYSRRLM